MSATKKYLAAISVMAGNLRGFNRPDVRTQHFFESTFDELMWQVYNLKPHLPPDEQEALHRLWLEYAATQPTELQPAVHQPGDYPEDRLATLLERFRKVVE